MALVADEAALAELPEDERYGSETDARQVFSRLAGTWTYWGWKGGYFKSEEDSSAFMDELATCSPPSASRPISPQWFNTGLHWAYGIDGPGQGHYYVDPLPRSLVKSKSSYEHTQPHACFIQGVGDDLVNEGGIMDLWVARHACSKWLGHRLQLLLSARRGRKAVGRRQIVGPYVLPQDRRPGARRHQVGRRHAPRGKMVVVDVDHPDIEAYIDWKVKEEQKVAASSPAPRCQAASDGHS